MKILARIGNSPNSNKVIVQTNANVQELQTPSKTNGYGSSVNGGEFLCLASYIFLLLVRLVMISH